MRAAPGRAAAGRATSTRLYRGEPALHELDCDPAGFEWIDANDAEQSVLSLPPQRRPASRSRSLVGVQLHAGAARNYRIGVPRAGRWHEILNSDAAIYGGSGMGNCGGVDASAVSSHGQPCSLALRNFAPRRHLPEAGRLRASAVAPHPRKALGLELRATGPRRYSPN